MLLTAFLTLLLSVAAKPVTSRSLENSTFINPILPGFHPDPSCIFVPEWDDTFFCATSSFQAFPGIPIHASKDLQNWKLVGHALNRPSQLPDFAKVDSTTGGLWAPTLRYENGTFWVVTTLVFDDFAANDSSRWDNIIFKGEDPYDEAAWSDAVHFDFNGYDTSPFWDTDGQAYMVGSHAYKVYPAIQLAKIDLETGETGDWETLWTGTGGMAPEAPHIYRKDDMYYLLIAEGGTGEGHMVTMARSPESIWGPYDASPGNPLLTAANTTRLFQTVGHADLFPDAADNWWAVALSTREDPSLAYHPMGRESVLTPVTWNHGEWPIFDTVEGFMEGWPRPDPADIKGDGPWISDGDDVDFAPGSSLPSHFTYWRYPHPGAFAVSPPDNPFSLQVKPSLENLTGDDGASVPMQGHSFVGRRQEHTLFTYSVDLDYSPSTIGEEAGVTVFLQQDRHIDMGLALLTPNELYLRVRGMSSSDLPSHRTILPRAWVGETLHLEIKAFNWTHYSFSAGPANAMSQLQTLAYYPNSAVSDGFTGTFLGVYATSNGGNGSTSAYFSNWSYIPQGQFLD